MPGIRTFKKIIFRKKRMSVYIEPSRIEELGWKPGQQLVMKKGRHGEAYIYPLDGIPVNLCHNINNNQWFVTFPPDEDYIKEKLTVRITQFTKGLIFNFF